MCGRSIHIPLNSRTQLQKFQGRQKQKAILCDHCIDIERQKEEARRQAAHNRWEEEHIKAEKRQAELEAMPYHEYLRSPEWANVRKAALRKAGYHCQLCYADGQLHVHHKTYDIKRGEEHWHDAIIVLCEECHRRFHKIEDT